MAETSQQYCCHGSGWDADSEKHNSGKEVGIPAEGSTVLNAVSKCVSARLVEAMCDRVSSLCLVRECRELKEMCGVAFTVRLLMGELMWGKNLKQEIRRVDRAQLLDRCGLRAPLLHKWRGKLDGQDLGMRP